MRVSAHILSLLIVIYTFRQVAQPMKGRYVKNYESVQAFYSMVLKIQQPVSNHALRQMSVK